MNILILWLAGFVAAGVVFLPRPVALLFLWAFIAVETAHAIAPIALAYGNREIREAIKAQPEWFILPPLVAIFLAKAAPFEWVLGAFTVANAWHFGMQNFGVMRFLEVRINRWLLMGMCLVATIAVMHLLPKLMPTPTMAFAVFMAVSLNHWITDLGLTKLASPLGVFLVLGLLLAGSVAFVWYRPTPSGMHRVSNELFRIPLALGFVHFLYSRWVWQRGRELLAIA